MAKLYFRYSAMNGGKSTALLQTAYNYEERGMSVLIMKPSIDTKGDDKVVSRIGPTRSVDVLIGPDDDIDVILTKPAIDCILIDEAQFLSPAQAEQLFWYAATGTTPVIAYGLRTDFATKGFPGASRLLELAHEITELKTICRCGRKALLNARKINKKFVFSGEQVAIDGKNDVEYEALCASDYHAFKIAAGNEQVG